MKPAMQHNAQQQQLGRSPRSGLWIAARAAGGGRGGGRSQTADRGGRGSGGRIDRRPKEIDARGPVKLKQYKNSDGEEHLGSALSKSNSRPFPGPPPDDGPPLRVLPIGGLGEIGMNCMLVGVRDRYILVDAGLLFPDYSDLGMQKILPDTSFLHQWRDKIEALVITHGHEDHIGAMPWVVPALDPSTPVFCGPFVMKLVKRRMHEFSLFDENRFHEFSMTETFQAGPFEVQPVRVTHSIPDCCGLIMRSEEGTIVHSGDWKIDETPLDGVEFDRSAFDLLGKEKISLFMSDSTNVLAPGRTTSEKVVMDSLCNKVMAHKGKGRVIITQFASNLTRLYGVKAAADMSGRKICFIGPSLSHYMEAAYQIGAAPFDPQDMIAPAQLKDFDPSQVLIVTTGSQAEPRAQLSLAAMDQSPTLKIQPDDLILYSAKVIPGNEPRVSSMLNNLALSGARVVQGRADNLHTSGHAYQDELKELLRYVKPQHFLPVHGEYAFLTEHARLAHEEAGVDYCNVIKNGQMLGVWERSSRHQVSSGSMAGSLAKVIGNIDLVPYYNDGSNGTGDEKEMAIQERTTLAFEGIVVVAVDVIRDAAVQYSTNLQGHVRVTVRGMWTDEGKLLEALHERADQVVRQLSSESPLAAVERSVIEGVRKACLAFNRKRPEVICIAHEHNPRLAHKPAVSASRRPPPPPPSSNGLDGSSRGGASESSYDSAPWERGTASSRSQQQSEDSGASSSGRSSSSSNSSRSEMTQQMRRRLAGSSSRAAGGRGGGRSRGGDVDGSVDEGGGEAKRQWLKGGPPPATPLPAEMLRRQRAKNPRENPGAVEDKEDLTYG